MSYIYDKKLNKWKRAPIPIVKGKLEQTPEMKKYLEKLRNEYKNVDWDLEIKKASEIKLKPVNF